MFIKGSIGGMKLEKQRKNENKYEDKTFWAFLKKTMHKKISSTI